MAAKQFRFGGGGLADAPFWFAGAKTRGLGRRRLANEGLCLVIVFKVQPWRMRRTQPWGDDA
jgi:hypothetical protein